MEAVIQAFRVRGITDRLLVVALDDTTESLRLQRSFGDRHLDPEADYCEFSWRIFSSAEAETATGTTRERTQNTFSFPCRQRNQRALLAPRQLLALPASKVSQRARPKGRKVKASEKTKEERRNLPTLLRLKVSGTSRRSTNSVGWSARKHCRKTRVGNSNPTCVRMQDAHADISAWAAAKTRFRKTTADAWNPRSREHEPLHHL